MVSLIAYKLTNDIPYSIIAVLIGSSYVLIPFFHHFRNYRAGRVYFSVTVPIAFSIGIITVGGNFGQELAMTATAVLSFFLHKPEPKLRLNLVIYTCILYILSTLYININGPILGARDYPFDEVVVYVLCFIWLSIVFLVYDKRMSKYIESLKVQNEELEEKSMQLERFTYIASHDLKSPLQNITNYLGLIEKETADIDNEKLNRYLEFTKTGAFTMNELIEGVLEISKSDKIDIEDLQAIDLNSALNKAISNLHQEIENRNVKISAQQLPNFHGREADFVLVFQNLIQNGIKYNKSSIPHIEIESTINKNILNIKFKDNGIGIESEYRSQVFEFFKRLHNSSEYPGTGLGLGLCKKLINKYDGKIQVNSEVGKYSIFTIILPFKMK
jgi:signal transduction histidine kinase